MASVTARPGNKASSSTLSFWEAAEDGIGGAIVTRVTMTRRMYMSRVHNCAARTALDSSPQLFVEYPKLVVPFRRSFGALIVALAAMLAAAQPDPATAEDRGAIPLQARSGALSDIDSSQGRSWEATIGNLQFANFNGGCVSCWNWSKRMLTTALDRRSVMR